MKNLNSLTFISGNLNKVKQVKKYLNFPIEHVELDLPEIQSLDLKEVVTYKVREAYQQIRKPVLVEDVALTFSCLGKLPGTFIKWFLKEIDKEKLCAMANAFSDSSATSNILYAFFDGKKMNFFEGEVKGTIAHSPKGENGFGFDSSFIPKGYRQTRGEMNAEDYEKTSPRKMALEKLEKFLKYGK